MTNQLSDTLIVSNDYLRIHSGPSLPNRHLGVRKALAGELSSLDAPCDGAQCKRGFIATWLIRENRLLLVGLLGRYRLTCGGPIMATWFTGVVRANSVCSTVSADRVSADRVSAGKVSADKAESTCEYVFEIERGTVKKMTQVVSQKRLPADIPILSLSA